MSIKGIKPQEMIFDNMIGTRDKRILQKKVQNY